MAPVDEWLDRYAEIRANRPSRAADWVTIPLLVMSLVGMLWSLPVPTAFSGSSPVLNWGTLFLMAAVVYYFILSISLAVGILPFVLAVFAAAAWLDGLQTPLWLVSGALFAVAAAWQLLEFQRVGNPRHIVRYFQFLMIAPLWLLASIYRRLGISY